MRKTIALVSLPVHAGILPLAAGTLECYSKRDQEIRSAYDFNKYSFDPAKSDSEILADLAATDASIYGFSCYVWNMGRVRRLINVLQELKPKSVFLLGGPQVINQGAHYLRPELENIYICNGEGEKTLHRFLLASLESSPDYSKVPGLSYMRDGTVLTTEPFERIKSLDEIPSPFLEGVFEGGRYSWFLLETNRGCPFRCTYCFWGGAIGAKINKYSEDRILEELRWIARYRAITLHIVDANVGIIERDVRFAERICEVHRETGYPKDVIFSASKNTPGRVLQLASTLADGGLLTSQPISLQTLSKRALEHVKRDNIKPDVYLETQRLLNAKGISSYVELIWPLPGETLDSFQEGIGELCRNRADSFTIYPLILINNVEMNSQQKEFDIQTIPDPDLNSEARIVIATKDVSSEDYCKGIKFAIAVTALYSGRGLWSLGRYLDTEKICSFRNLISSVVEFATEHSDSALARYTTYVLQGNQHKFSSFGGTLHCTHFADRPDFDRLLANYVASQEWFDDTARLHFELDLVNRPYVYAPKVKIPDFDFKFLRIEVIDKSKLRVVAPASSSCASIIQDHFRCEGPPGSTTWNVDFKGKQWPHAGGRSETANYMYCHEKLEKMGTILAKWTAA